MHDDLRRAGPLGDPVRVLSTWVLSTTLFGLGALAVTQLGPIAPELIEEPGFALLLVVLYLSLGVALPGAMWLLMRPARREPVFYLRAFRADTEAAPVLSAIRAALGPRYRLCGIRPPHVRLSWVARLFLTTGTGLRYVGSDRFDLEGDDVNWLARLLASYARGHLVVVDAREMTPHLADEIRLSYLVMGPPRTCIIGDSARSEAALRSYIVDLLGDAEIHADGDHLCILSAADAGPEGVKLLCQQLAGVVRHASETPSNVSAGVPFVQARLPRAAWPTRALSKDWAQLLISTVVANGIMLASLVGLGATVRDLLVKILLGGLLIVHWGALWRSTRAARSQATYSAMVGGPNPRWPPRIAMVLTIYWMLAFLFVEAVAIPGLKRTRVSANEAMAIAALRAVNSAEAAYSSACAGGGYAVALEDLAKAPEGSTQGFVFISADLSKNGVVKSGYRITLSGAPGATVVTAAAATCNGAGRDALTAYFAEAHPVALGITGIRSFATDENGTIYSRDDGSAIAPGMAGAVPLR